MEVPLLEQSLCLGIRQRHRDKFRRVAYNASDKLFIDIARETHRVGFVTASFDAKGTTFNPNEALRFRNGRILLEPITFNPPFSRPLFRVEILEWAAGAGIDVRLHQIVISPPGFCRYYREFDVVRCYVNFGSPNDAFAWKMRWNGVDFRKARV